MMIRFKQLVRSAKCVVLSALAATALGSTAFGDTVLTKDEDWHGQEAEKLTGTIDLNGHKLTVSQLTGDATITDSTVRDYELLDYIQSDGTQSIKTGCMLESHTCIDMSFMLLDMSKTGVMFGSASWGNGNYNFMVENKIFKFQDATGKVILENAKTSVIKTVSVRQNKVTVGSSTKSANTALSGDHELLLFGAAGNPAKIRMYSMKVCAPGGTTVLRDFVPARRMSDGAIGLLDKANPGPNEFYVQTNGGNNFVAGTKIGDHHIGGIPGELHVDVASDTITGGATLTGGAVLVKDGEGTLKWNGGANSVAASCPVVVTNGVFGFATDADNVFGSGGTITIAGKGQMDIAKLSADDSRTSSPVYNRTFYIEGDGPDGKGAIVRNCGKTGNLYGPHLKTVHLTGNATIGGTTRIDFRPQTGDSSMLHGEGHVLTIKNTDRVAFCGGDSGCNVDRIVVADGGFLQPCSDAKGTLEVKCIELRNGGKLISWHETTTGTYALTIPVVVSEGSCATGSDQGYFSVRDVEVKGGATFAVEKGAVSITGTLSGGGTVSGAIAFSGAATRWTMAADAEGWTEKATLTGVNANALAALAAIDITYAGTTSKELEIGPALGLTETTLPALTVKTPDGGEIAGTLAIKDGKLYVNIDLNAVVTATWTGAGEDGKLDNPANWACTNALGGAVVGRLPIEQTTVTFVGDKVPSIQTESPFAAKAVVLSGAELSADCNWSGLIVPVSGTIDLKGNKLTVADLPATWTAEITDTSVRDYDLLDYILSDGTQSIKTGCMLESHTWIDMSFMLLVMAQGRTDVMFSSGGWGAGNYIFMAENKIFKFYDAKEKISPQNAAIDVKRTVSVRQGKVSVDSSSKSANTALSGEHELVVFGGAGPAAKIRMYSMKVCAPGGTQVWRDFVPARRKSDGAVGLLDLANPGPNEFYVQTNGGNNFVAGTKTGDHHIGGIPGELHVVVASGATVVNSTVALTGGLKLVKEGDGAFTATKTGQTYSGGTEVAGGQFNVPSGSESASQCLGAADTPVTVGAVATLELNGNTTFNVHPLVLAGGTVQNSSATEAKLGDITLTADSLLKTPYAGQYGDFGIASGSTIDLGGFKLTVDFLQKKNKQLVIYGPGVQMANGTLRLQNSGSGWGCLYLKDGDIDAPTVNFEVADAQFNVVSNLSIGDFIAEGGSTVENHAGGGKLKVYGKFQPWTDFFFGCELQTGAVLDLSKQSGVWNSTSRVKTSSVKTPRTVTFADGATITIDVGERAVAGNHGKIVSWTAAPANVTFQLAEGILGRVEVTNEGIFLRRGMTLIVR